MGRPRRTAVRDALAPGWPTGWPLWLFLAFVLVGVAVYWPSLDGLLVSDDHSYFGDNPYVSRLSLENLRQIWDPFGAPAYYVANYAPVHLTLHALLQYAFGLDVTVHHVVNLVLHAANCVLLIALFLESRIPPTAALLAGVAFLVHPANVEAVAWMSQLKTLAAFGLGFGAVWLHPRRPFLGALAFTLAMLTKPIAVAALALAVGIQWTRNRSDRRAWSWLALWLLVFACHMPVEMHIFQDRGQIEAAAFEDVGVHLRTVAAIGTRYLVMASTSQGVGAFQEPDPVLSWFDPWWLASLPLGLWLAWRMLSALRRRDEEGAWWLCAAVAFAPISQIFPFEFPIADRYLYFVLPGLLGGALLASLPTCRRWAADARLRWPVESISRAAAIAVLVVCAAFAFHAHRRANLWQNELRLLREAAARYPESATAHYLRARLPAQNGDVQAALISLRAAVDAGLDDFVVYARDPGLAPIRGTPDFNAFLAQTAERWLRRQREPEMQWDLRKVARAYVLIGEPGRARPYLERALALGGPFDEAVRAELAELDPSPP